MSGEENTNEYPNLRDVIFVFSRTRAVYSRLRNYQQKVVNSYDAFAELESLNLKVPAVRPTTGCVP
jgi:hypothetical protein